MAPPNVTLQAPNSSFFNAIYVAADGTTTTIGSTGLVTVPATNNNVSTLLNAGFIVSSDLEPVTDSLVALAGGGQTGATQLAIGVNRVATVVTAADSVALPVAASGIACVVINDAANAMQVFGRGTDTVNGIAAATGISQPGKSVQTYVCVTSGAWVVQAGTGTLPPAKYTKNTTSGATVAAAGDMTGAAYVCAEYSAVGATNLTTRTAAQLFADLPNAKVGDSFMLLVTNTSGGTTTLVAGSGVTITGTATMATNTTRLFNVKFVSASAVTFQSVLVGTIS
jgi:hypothetical protein